MQRRQFIKTSCAACLSLTTATLIMGCIGTKYISGTLSNDGLTIQKKDFEIKQKGSTAYSSFLIVRNDALQFPICVYRLGENEYTALWMRCSHQGAELQASGDVLHCTAHGSEFNNKGHVISGPAASQLRTFPVTIIANQIFIDLRKQS